MIASAPLSSSQTRLAHDRRRRDDDAACILHALEQRLVRQAEMEAHHRRLQLFDQLAHRRIKRRAIGGCDRRVRIETQLAKVRRQPLAPARLLLGRAVDRLVAEEIHVERRRHALPHDVHLLARLVHGQHRAWQRRQRPALRRADHDVGVLGARHRRLHDRHVDLEQVEQSAIRPHLRALLGRARAFCRLTAALQVCRRSSGLRHAHAHDFGRARDRRIERRSISRAAARASGSGHGGR